MITLVFLASIISSQSAEPLILTEVTERGATTRLLTGTETEMELYGLVEPPRPTTALDHIHRLTLHRAQFDEFAWLADLDSLRRLHLISLNSFSSQDLNQLELDTLRIHDSPLANRSLTLCQPQLSYLQVYRSDMSRVEICEMPHLETLDTQQNALSHFDWLAQLPALAELSIDASEIVTIASLPSLNELKRLSLERNSLIDLLDLAPLPELEQMIIDSNRLVSLQGLFNAPKLKILSANGNRIRTLRGLESLTELVYLDVQENRLTSLDLQSPLPNLESLYVSGNPLESLVGLQQFPGLKELHLGTYEGLLNVGAPMPSVTQVYCRRTYFMDNSARLREIFPNAEFN